MSQRVSLGRVVHIQVAGSEYRPAIVVRIHSMEQGIINAVAFMDGLNDEHLFDESMSTHSRTPLTKWYTSISPGSDVGQWKWPEII